MEKDGIRVSSYWTETLPKDLLQKKLHEAVAIARANLEARMQEVKNLGSHTVPIKPSKSAPTRQQGQFLAFIREYMMRNEHGVAPTHAAFQKFFDLTPPSVNSMLIRLEHRGYIKRTPGQARGIQLIIPSELIPPLDRWKTLAESHPDSESHREPPARLRSPAQPYFRALEKIRRSPDSLADAQRDFLISLLPVLGYTLDPTWRAVGQGSTAVRIPLIGEVATQSGAPALWLIETLPIGPSDDELATDTLALTPHLSQYTADPQNQNPQLPGQPRRAGKDGSPSHFLHLHRKGCRRSSLQNESLGFNKQE